jgi:hypothetical protein
MRRLVKLAAKLVDDFQRELYALRTPRTLQEMACGLRSVPVSKDKADTRPAIIPNYLDPRASDDPAHLRFDSLWFHAKTAVAGFNDPELDEDFRRLANTVAKALKNRVSESEVCRWEFHGTLVSPSFVREISGRIFAAK